MISQARSITISQLPALEDLCIMKSHEIQRISSLLDDQVNFHKRNQEKKNVSSLSAAFHLFAAVRKSTRVHS